MTLACPIANHGCSVRSRTLSSTVPQMCQVGATGLKLRIPRSVTEEAHEALLSCDQATSCSRGPC